MLVVMVSKWVADAFGKEGIYEAWITLRGHPWLAPLEYHDHGETASAIMTPLARLVTINGRQSTIKELGLSHQNFSLKIK